MENIDVIKLSLHCSTFYEIAEGHTLLLQIKFLKMEMEKKTKIIKDLQQEVQAKSLEVMHDMHCLHWFYFNSV